MQYAWAANPSKLQRAVDKVGAEGTEEQIKEYYIKLGGRVLEIKKQGRPKNAETPPLAL